MSKFDNPDLDNGVPEEMFEDDDTGCEHEWSLEDTFWHILSEGDLVLQNPCKNCQVGRVVCYVPEWSVEALEDLLAERFCMGMDEDEVVEVREALDEMAPGEDPKDLN